MNQLSEDLAQAQEARDAALAAQMAAEDARDTAQSTLQTTQGQLTTTQTELDETEEDLDTAEGERDAAQTARDAAQAAADAQALLAQQQQEEEDSAESITRALGLLEALEPEFRADANDPNPANSRIHASNILMETDPFDSAPRSPRVTNLHSSSVRLTVMNDGEFSSVGGIPSLSMGGSSLRSTRLERDDPQNKTQEMAFYTDFRPRNRRLLDVYSDVLSAEDREISLAQNVNNDTSISVNEKMRERTGNARMYAGRG